MNIRFHAAAMLSAGLMLAAGAAWGAEDGKEKAKAHGHASNHHEAMMAAWQKAATPGDQHAWLTDSAGSWNVKQTMWMQPGAEPTVDEGTAERVAILGGRVLRETFSATFMGQPYQGVAHSGYDNVTGKYWVTWLDNMSTAVYSGEGECNDDRNRCTYHMSGTDPMTGGQHKMRIEVAFKEGGEFHTFHEVHEGEERKTMEMVYTPAED